VTAIPWAFCGAGVLSLAASQGAEWAVERLVPAGGARVLIPRVLSLAVVHNQGIAFGLLARLAPIVSVALALTVLAVLFYNRGAWPAVPAGQWGVGLMFGGALGNIVDRFRFGYVIDYLDVHVWPVFNLADAAIVAGAGVVAAASLIRRRREMRGVSR